MTPAALPAVARALALGLLAIGVCCCETSSAGGDDSGVPEDQSSATGDTVGSDQETAGEELPDVVFSSQDDATGPVEDAAESGDGAQLSAADAGDSNGAVPAPDGAAADAALANGEPADGAAAGSDSTALTGPDAEEPGFEAVAIQVALASERIAFSAGGAAALSGVPHAAQVWVKLVDAQGGTLDITCHAGTSYDLSAAGGGDALALGWNPGGCESGLLLTSTGVTTGPMLFFVTSSLLPGGVVSGEVVVVDHLTLVLSVHLQEAAGALPGPPVTVFEVFDGAPFPPATYSVDMVLTDGDQFEITDNPALAVTALDPDSGQPSSAVLTVQAPNLVLPVAYGEAVLAASLAEAGVQLELAVVQAVCEPPNAYYAAAKEACVALEDQVSSSFADTFETYDFPLGSLTEAPPQDLATCPPEGWLEFQVPTGVGVQMLANLLTVDLYNASDDILAMHPVPPGLSADDQAAYDQMISTCFGGSIQAAATTAIYLELCPAATTCISHHWASHAGALVGAGLFATAAQQWMAEAGLTNDYESVDLPQPLCIDTFVGPPGGGEPLEVIRVAALGNVSATLVTDPLCPGFTPLTPDQAIAYQDVIEQYEDGMVQGINTEHVMFIHRLNMEGMCCKP